MREADIQLKALADGRPALCADGKETPVHVVPCFPWSHPERHLSLRDGEGEEKAFVEDPARLDPESRGVLLREIENRGKVFTITAIHEVEKEIELRCWEVDTPGGPRSFQTELDEWPRALPDGSLVVEDLFSDLYRIPDPDTLDPASRKILLPLLG